MSASDNATLLSDATSLMKSEKISMPNFVKMISAFTKISNTETLDMIKSSISTIKKQMTDAEVLKYIDMFQYRFLEGSYKRLGLNEIKDESAEDKKLRGTVIGGLATINTSIKEPIKELDEFLLKHLADFTTNPNENKISNDIKPAVMFKALKGLDSVVELDKYFKL